MKNSESFSLERDKFIKCTSKQYELLKRLFDIIISFFGLVFVLPLLLFIMVYTSYKSYGPVFTYSEVLGYRGRIFKVYSFCNRRENDEKIMRYIESNFSGGTREKPVNEGGKITVIDRLACSRLITELLQLFNVLKGDMSIVGPEPKSSDQLKQSNKWYYIRLSAKPGIIGLWDVYKRRGDGFDEMVWYDLKYLKERRLMYDLKIIADVLILKIAHNKKR